MTIADILQRLEGVKGRGCKYMARCPNHDDSNPSLSVSLGDDNKILLKCFAGCSTEAIVRSMGLELKDLFAEPAAAFPTYGKSKIYQPATLARLLGYKTVRELQKQVEAERAAGYVILCDSQGAGYYLSDDPEELRRFVNTLNARARNTIKAAQSAQRALDAASGQESIAGWYDG